MPPDFSNQQTKQDAGAVQFQNGKVVFFSFYHTEFLSLYNPKKIYVCVRQTERGRGRKDVEKDGDSLWRRQKETVK